MATTTSPHRDVSIDYLRTTLTLMVLAHHSSLAYTTFAHFDKQHIFQSTAPVVDVTRWPFFDYAENFNDVFFMSLMFFVSGLFVYGPLARRWRLWISGCFLAYNALVIVPRVYPQPTLEAFLWVLSCVASCFGFLALFRGIELTPRLWMNSLSRSAYVMYLVHYVFITWTQRVVLDRPIHAGIKFLFVFLSTTLLSWLTAQIVLRIPKLKTIL